MPQRAVQRRPTMPMRKEDSESLSELIQNQQPLITSPKHEVKSTNSLDSILDNKGKSTLQRSDSYKAATSKENRFSVLVANEEFNKKRYDKEKYRTLPSEMGTLRKQKTRQKVVKNVTLLRQESGVVPSPDTDEDRWSCVSDRRKKTTFQRAKERILHTFQKQSQTDDEKRQKRQQETEKRKQKKRAEKMKKKLKISKMEVITEDVRADSTSKKTNSLKRILSLRRPVSQSADEGRRLPKHNGVVKNQEKKESGGQKVWPEHSRVREFVSKLDDTDGHPTEKQPLSPTDELFKSLMFNEVQKGRSRNYEPKIPEATKFESGMGNRNGLSLDLSLTNRRNRKIIRRISSEKEDFKETVTSQHGRYHMKTRYTRQVSVYSDVEIDGDVTDCPPSPQKEKQPKDNRKFSELSAEEKERRISEVASRLKVIGDKAVQKLDSESTSSGVESPLRGASGGPRPSAHSLQSNDEIVSELVKEFREKGDRFSRELNLGSLTPVVLDIARQQTYESFKEVVHSSLRNTLGWEQIALYFYLTKTAVHVAGASMSVAQMAVDYFREKYSGWVEENGGWETMIEETDCELD